MTTEDTAAATPQAQGTAAPSNSAGQASETATEDHDDGQDESGEGESGAEPQPKKDAQPDKKQARLDRRIGELTYRAKQAEREAAELKTRLAEVEKRTAPKPPERPKQENFKTNEEYEDALLEWNDARKQHAKDPEKKQETKQSPNAVSEDHAAKFKEAETAFAEANPDYDDVLEDFSGDLPQDVHGAAIANVVLRHARGPELIYHLGKNPDVLDQVLSLHPARIPAKLERIAATLTKPAASKQQQLPNPPTPLKGGGAATPDSQLSGRELRKKHGVL